MTVNIDRRDFRESRLTDARMDEMHTFAGQASQRLAEGQGAEVTRFDPTTGNAATVRTLHPKPVQGDFVDAALRHVYAIAPAFGLASTIREFAPDPAIQRTRGGGSVVHVHQRYRGIGVFEAELTVRFDPRGAITETAGSVIAEPPEPAGERILAEQAVRIAAQQCAAAPGPPTTDQFGQPLEPTSVDLEGFAPRVIAAFTDSPECAAVLDAATFERPIQAALVWFPLTDQMRLGWDVWLQLTDSGSAYRTIVACTTGEVLYHHELAHGLLGIAEVYEIDGSTPRATKTLPADTTAYRLPQPPELTAGFPADWLGSAKTEGPFAIAHVGTDGLPVSGKQSAQGVTFAVSDAEGDDQKVVNLFYYCSLLHDIYYLLGFQEADGNFQAKNGAGPSGNHRVEARVSLQEIPRTARFVTPPDGGQPLMEMGPITATGRHCAFDATVVFHEYTHGVSSRLIGGPMSSTALLSPQSAGIAEGLSDFFSCTLNNTTTIARWVVDKHNGIRQYPYDDAFPDGFGEIGTGRYVESHAIGEVCAATLMDLVRACGRDTTLQLVMDAMKLTAPNPSFLNMRDAVLAAAEDLQPDPAPQGKESSDLTAKIWGVFAKRGMGAHAACNGAQLAGIVADGTIPTQARATGSSS